MARTGRPKKPKSERQSHLIALRLTPAEHRKLEQAAQKSDLSVSDYVRRALGFKKR
jgi:predicted HicB family RNase H-like nuclease